MTELQHVPTGELFLELARRGALPRCPCGRWRTYQGSYDADGYTWRCAGCRRTIARCRCR